MIQEPNCFKRGCTHNIRVEQPDGTEETEVNACDAYPNEIPEDIAYGDELHLTVRKDQKNKIVFQTKE